MRVLMIGHAYVTPANQMLLGEMEAIPDVEVALVAPARWRASVGGVREFARYEGFSGPTLPRPVRLSGNINAYRYRGLDKGGLPWPPDVVFADEEAYSLAAHQALGGVAQLGAYLGRMASLGWIRVDRDLPFGVGRVGEAMELDRGVKDLAEASDEFSFHKGLHINDGLPIFGHIVGRCDGERYSLLPALGYVGQGVA